MADYLEKHLYEMISGPNDQVDKMTVLLKGHNLYSNYVFSSDFSKRNNCHGYPILYLAVMFEQTSLVSLLLSQDVGACADCARPPFEFEIDSDDPFKRTAVFRGLESQSAKSVGIFKVLLATLPFSAFCSVDSSGCSILWHAVNIGSIEKVRALLRSVHVANLINLPDSIGLTPLHVSAVNDNAEIADLLLYSGAKIDCIQHEGATPLCIAAKRCCLPVVKTLLMHGANPNHFADNGVVFKNESELRKIKALTNFATFINPCTMASFLGMRNMGLKIVLTLVVCGAIWPRFIECPVHFPHWLHSELKSVRKLQLICVTVIRKRLVQRNSGNSIRSSTMDLTGVIPESLISLIRCDFLKQFLHN